MPKPLIAMTGLDGLARRNRLPTAATPAFGRIAADQAKADEAEVYLYGEIGGWWDGVQPVEFAREIGALDVATLNVRINSPGGSVFDGVAIYNALASHAAKVVIHVEGVAASIASVIAMAGDEIRIGEAASIMIHKPWSFVMGDADAMRHEADVLDTLEGGLVDIYAARTGNAADDIRTQLAAETWFRGQAAVDAGYADTVTRAKKKADPAPSDLFDLFRNAPAALRSAVAGPADDPAVRRIEKLLKQMGNLPNAMAKQIACAIGKVVSGGRDADRTDPRDADERMHLARRLAAGIRQFTR